MDKQTAVEWLIEQVHSDEYQKAFGQTYISIDIVEQAKAMEKEQIVESYFKAYWDTKNDVHLIPSLRVENYFEETYGSGNNL